MRTIMKAARILLHSRNMSKSLWAEAVNTAVFVLNRVSSSSVKNTTPFKLWFGKDFDMKIFKEFSSVVSAHIPKEKRRKLDAKNEEGIFVGYGDSVKGYRIFFPNKNTVELHRDIVILPSNDTVEKTIPSENKKNIEEVITLTLDENSDHQSESSVDEQENVNETEADEKPMKRERRESKRPGWMQDYETSCFAETEEPMTFEEPVTSKNSKKWKEAMEKELKVLRENNTWTEVPWPVDKKVIESKWIFKKKSESEFKARLVARGFQQEGEAVM